MTPKFSVLLTLREPGIAGLRATIDSVVTQSYRDWELVIVGIAMTSVLLDLDLARLERSDSRIRLVRCAMPLSDAEALNEGLSSATGEFVTILRQGDLLTIDAFASVADAIEQNPSVDYLYSDEERLELGPGLERRYTGVTRKPDWSPERLRSQFYCGSLSILRRTLATEVGGFDSRFDGVHDYDLVLRVTERARLARHIDRVLYRVVVDLAAAPRPEDAVNPDLRVEVVRAHLARSGIEARAVRGPRSDTVAIDRRLPAGARVSVIIPTNGSGGIVGGRRRVFVLNAVRSLLDRCGDIDLEIVLVWDTGMNPETISRLRRMAGSRLRLVEFTQPFNFSEKCNLGVLESSGEFVVMLNDDIELLSDDFIARLCAPLLDPDVGMTGAMQLYEDGTIQHAGQSFGEGAWGHAHIGEPGDASGHQGSLLVDHEVSGVTASCAALRRDVFTALGGYDTRLPGNFQDVDFSYKVRHSGRRIVWVAGARMLHFESKTRVPTLHDWEVAAIHERWGAPVGRDPYHPPASGRERLDDIDDQVRGRATVLKLTAG
ncbi:MAG TPA: glycosyltransferase [Microbacteriaceae bacterium]|nr:glycosyltransferase [Microbacteriaceae bacterium]